MADQKTNKSTGPKTSAGKAIAARNATIHGLTSNQVLPDEVKMVDDFVKELAAYYKPQSPLEVLQIQRIAFCRAKLAKLMDIEVAGREIFRRDIENHPEAVFAKLDQYPLSLRNLALFELTNESVLKTIQISTIVLQQIALEIKGFAGVVQSEAELLNSFPKLCSYLSKIKPTKEQIDEFSIDQKLLIFSEKIKQQLRSISTIEKPKEAAFEEMLRNIELNEYARNVTTKKIDRSSNVDPLAYWHLVKKDLNEIVELADLFSKLKPLQQSYEDMKSWMLRSVDLSAQESERMMRYQVMLEKRLSTAIGELLMLQKIASKSNFSIE